MLISFAFWEIQALKKANDILFAKKKEMFWRIQNYYVFLQTKDVFNGTLYEVTYKFKELDIRITHSMPCVCLCTRGG